MRFSLVSAALLCFTTWMSIVRATHGPLSQCCLGWSNTKVRLERILNYTIQSEGVCSIAAAVFETKSGARICSDPDSGWAKRTILKVDEQKKRVLQEKEDEGGSASDITSTVSTTLKTTPKKKCRKGRRHQRKKSRRGRKGQRKRVM